MFIWYLNDVCAGPFVQIYVNEIPVSVSFIDDVQRLSSGNSSLQHNRAALNDNGLFVVPQKWEFDIMHLNTLHPPLNTAEKTAAK